MKNPSLVRSAGIACIAVSLVLPLSSCGKRTEEPPSPKATVPPSGQAVSGPGVDSFLSQPESGTEEAPDLLADSLYFEMDGAAGDIGPEGDSIALSGPLQLLGADEEGSVGEIFPESPEPMPFAEIVYSWPEDIPADVPRFAEGRLSAVNTSGNAGMKIWSMTFDEVPDQVTSAYDEALKSAGFQTMTTLKTIGGLESGSITARKGGLRISFRKGSGMASLTATQSK
ncbi:hypothetical protein CHL67_05870 [Prosthecochloris sp. GSB1]|uniref:hypothetical protein n=1 Tax=Prosthecochloris sp. GSB1 TaxID=281093 RepID=UPI000B8CD999|nr:hypothetical protein [Prosthecochloris sp. GSB1]ASQ90509.1 hypothetical protein CHL67_05870 [Prosthecochloris sp. GSB1]